MKWPVRKRRPWRAASRECHRRADASRGFCQRARLRRAAYPKSGSQVSWRRLGGGASDQRHIRQHMTAARPGIIMPAFPRASKEVRGCLGAVMHASKADERSSVNARGPASVGAAPSSPVSRHPRSHTYVSPTDDYCADAAGGAGQVNDEVNSGPPAERAVHALAPWRCCLGSRGVLAALEHVP